MRGYGAHLSIGVSEPVTVLWVTFVSHKKNISKSLSAVWTGPTAWWESGFTWALHCRAASPPFLLQRGSDIQCQTHGVAKRHHEYYHVSYTPPSPSPLLTHPSTSPSLDHHKELQWIGWKVVRSFPDLFLLIRGEKSLLSNWGSTLLSEVRVLDSYLAFYKAYMRLPEGRAMARKNEV